jgi:hypothetical protein
MFRDIFLHLHFKPEIAYIFVCILVNYLINSPLQISGKLPLLRRVNLEGNIYFVKQNKLQAPGNSVQYRNPSVGDFSKNSEDKYLYCN